MSGINFICLKWGKKYGPEYVNRLYAHLENAYDDEFRLYCFTDKNKDLNSKIIIRDIEELRPYPYECFTLEKIFLFDHQELTGKNVLLDLDVLLFSDNLKRYLDEYDFCEPRFIQNYWNGIEYGNMLAKHGRNWVNSSFVTWKDDQLIYIKRFYEEHKDVIEYKFGDLDFWLFQLLRDRLHYHPEKIVYSYRDGATEQDYGQYKLREDHSVVLFNTSHGYGTELHETVDWSQRLWTQFD
jgi:hypothetical protein